MGTEADKTNTAVIATMFAVGAAAMLGGSAAIVGLARGEVREFSEQNGAYADLDSIRQLRAQQQKQLGAGKLPIDKARSLVLKQIAQDPNAASPFTPPPEPKPDESDAGAGGAATSGESAAGTASGTAPEPQPKQAPTKPAPAPNSTGTGPVTPAPEAPEPEAPAPKGKGQ